MGSITERGRLKAWESYSFTANIRNLLLGIKDSVLKNCFRPIKTFPVQTVIKALSHPSENVQLWFYVFDFHGFSNLDDFG